MKTGLDRRSTIAFLLGTAIVGLAALLPTLGYALPDPRRGEALATEHCSGCHAVGTIDQSRNTKAPPFRTLSERYPLDNLQEALAEGIVVGHEGQEMPEFEFSPDDVADIIAHMKRISTKR
jgi:mono/diheme cytochrome c family protein